MTTTTANLAELGIELDRAKGRVSEIEGEIDRVKRDASLVQLEGVCNEMNAFEEDLERNRPALHSQRDNWSNARNKIQRASEAVAESIAAKSPVVGLLPNDPESVRWSKKHDSLVLALAEAKAELNLLPNPEILQRRLAEVSARLQQLTFVKNNLLAAIEGKTGKAFVGSLSGVW